jgi:hypothetical protein
LARHQNSAPTASAMKPSRNGDRWAARSSSLALGPVGLWNAPHRDVYLAHEGSVLRRGSHADATATFTLVAR